MSDRRLVLLVQLPVPPPGPGAVEGNVPLAAAYLKLFARRRGLEDFCHIEVLPPALANALGDQALIRAILARQPWMVGFTCYLWNIERTLWIAGRLRQSRPELKVLVGGPEITADNLWVLRNPAVDYAVLGEGETTFAELLAALADERNTSTRPGAAGGRSIPGLWHAGGQMPPPRTPLAELDAISSPYVEGIVDLSDSRRMLLETARAAASAASIATIPKGTTRRGSSRPSRCWPT